MGMVVSVGAHRGIRRVYTEGYTQGQPETVEKQGKVKFRREMSDSGEMYIQASDIQA